MDELEIDGKKYLSSRRAAKEHKYHIDYFGQLIRAGKVHGKKVGRSWYVEETSLKSYLLQEAGTQPTVQPQAAPAVPEPQVEVQPEPEPQPVEEVEQIEVHTIEIQKPAPAPTPVYVPQPAAPVVLHERAVPITSRAEPVSKPSTLTYIEDDEPLLPVLDRNRTNADFVSIPMRRVEAEAEQEQEVAEEEPKIEVYAQQTRTKRKSSSKFSSYASRTALLAGIAVAVFALVAAGSSLLVTSINVNEGQPASVGVTVK